MLMQPPPGGADFTGNSGFSYAAKDGEQVLVGDGDVAMAIRLNWSQADPNQPRPAVVKPKVVLLGVKSF